jgi:hypothetical protein
MNVDDDGCRTLQTKGEKAAAETILARDMAKRKYGIALTEPKGRREIWRFEELDWNWWLPFRHGVPFH